MTTRTMSRFAVVLAALAICVGGCGTDEAGLGEGGTGGVAIGTGNGGVTGGGGQGGVAQQAGTGGIPAIGTGGTFAPMTGATPYNVAISKEIGYQFTRADHDMCMEWPVCPADVIAPFAAYGRVMSQQCTRTFDGGRLHCGACMLRSTAVLFVGRCLAPFVVRPGSGMFGGEFQTTKLSAEERRTMADAATEVVTGGWALCTGDAGSYTDANGVPVTETFDATVHAGVNANTVCKD
jgi:hypothetical protein